MSGSAPYLKYLKYIADLDCCEYTEDITHCAIYNGRCSEELYSRILKITGLSGNTTLRLPTPNDHLLGTLRDAIHSKMDAVGKTPVGVLEVTNKVLTKGQEHLTHGAQQIPIARMRDSYFDLEKYIKYMSFLYCDIVYHIEITHNWTKALKRALALAIVSHDQELANILIDLFNETNLAEDACLKAKEELLKGIKSESDPILASLAGKLQDEISGGRTVRSSGIDDAKLWANLQGIVLLLNLSIPCAKLLEMRART